MDLKAYIFNLAADLVQTKLSNKSKVKSKYGVLLEQKKGVRY